MRVRVLSTAFLQCEAGRLGLALCGPVEPGESSGQPRGVTHRVSILPERKGDKHPLGARLSPAPRPVLWQDYNDHYILYTFSGESQPIYGFQLKYLFCRKTGEGVCGDDEPKTGGKA